MNANTLESNTDPYLGQPQMDLQRIYTQERFPNVVITLKGTTIATWGTKNYVVRRSEDGGTTWEPEILVGPGMHGGGVTVDENSGDILVFMHPEHPPKEGKYAARTMFRSTDDGKTWHKEEAVFTEDERGNIPSLHFHEHGITLHRGSHAGRLLRPARVYIPQGGYNTAIFSDDHGKTWQTSTPFPLNGTGEGCVAEMQGGRIYYSSRKHWFNEDEPYRSERLNSWSDNGGNTWSHPKYNNGIPDGPQYRGEERREACYNGHFGMAAGLVRLPIADKDIMIYSNADQVEHQRDRMTVWASFDGGQTWPIKRLVYADPSAYSSLNAGRPNTPSEGWIYLQFEERQGGGQIARFNLSWLLDGEKTNDGALPDWLDK
jgi:sialidase-1